MDLKMNQTIGHWISKRKTFVVANVVKVTGSASAKPGARALIDENGKNIMGWVGGGCAERFICEQALESLKERRARMVHVDLDDEILGVGMPCGGHMEVFVEPYLPKTAVLVVGDGQAIEIFKFLARLGDFDVFEEGSSREGHVVDFTGTVEYAVKASGEPRLSDAENSVVTLGRLLARVRGGSSEPLVLSRGVFPAEQIAAAFVPEKFRLSLVGHSRITEELAKIATICRWPVSVLGLGLETSEYPPGVDAKRPHRDYSELQIDKNDVVLVAAHHRGDPVAIARALNAGAGYVGLIASAKRAKLVAESLREDGIGDEMLRKLRAPAGLDLGCITPFDIALSIACEILALRLS